MLAKTISGVKPVRRSMEYEEMPLSKTTKKGIRVVSEMSNAQIVWYFIARNGCPISVMLNVTFFSYLAWDKVLHLFF